MRIKLDENIPRSLATLLRSGGHDVSTVQEGNLLCQAGALRVKMFLNSGGYERAVHDRRFDPLFEF